MMNATAHRIRYGIVLAFATTTPWVQAQTHPGATADEAAALPDVVVTADKIERRLEQVAASVAVIDGADLEQSGIVSMAQLEGRIAGLSFQPFGQSGMKAPVMRGMTASVHSYASSVLLLVDDVPTLTAQGFENNFLDVNRVEVLRGPQSTLYGRNAESGVIAIHSRAMNNTPRTSVSTEIGNHNKKALRFTVSRPLLEDRLYASISGNWRQHDGFIHNAHTGQTDDDRKHKDLKLGLRWTPTGATDIVVRYVRQAYDDGATLWGNASDPRALVASGTPSWNRSLGQTFSVKAVHEFESGLRLQSVTAYNDYHDKVFQDTDFRPAPIMFIGRDNHLRTLSQEVRLEGQLGQTSWLLGLYGDQGHHSLHHYGQRGPYAFDDHARLNTDSLALFSNWQIPLSPRWAATAGGRIERMSAQIRPSQGIEKKEIWSSFSPKLALQYQIHPLHQGYVSSTRGVRSGGYNMFVSALDYPSYAPEESWSYEAGVKGWALAKRLRYSAVGYVMKTDNMQVQTQPVFGVIYTASAAKATSKGAEFDVDYLLGHGVQLLAGLAWNRTIFDQFQDGGANYTGKYNSFVPKMTGHLSMRYTAPKDWYAQAGMVSSSKLYLDSANQYKRSGYVLVNVVVGYQRAGWDIAAYANNVADKKYDAVGYNAGYYSVYSPPREVGVRLTWHM